MDIKNNDIIDISGLKYKTNADSDLIVLLGNDNYKNEISEDYIIPDYISDVKKILHTFARPKMKNRYINGNKLIFDGEIVFTVLLLTEDNNVSSVSITSAYNNTAEPKYLAERKDPGDNRILSVSQSMEGVEGRLLNPRKINVKAKLSSRLGVSGREQVASVISGLKKSDDEAGIERRTKTVPSLRLTQVSGEDLTISEDIELDASMPPANDILFCGADIGITDYRREQDRINVSGEAVSLIIYSADNGEIAATVRKIPVTATLEADRVGPDCEYYGSAVVGTIKANIENNSYGENRIIELDITYNIDLLCVSNEDTELLLDIYSTDYDCKHDSKEVSVYSVSRCINTNFSVNASKERKEIGAESARDIVFTSATANITNINKKTDNGKLVAEGIAELLFITKNGEDDEISSYHFNVPFKCEPDAGETGNDFEYVCRAAASNIRGRLDSGYLYCDFEILLDLLLINRNQEKVVIKAAFDSENRVNADRPPIILYYPQPGEKLWDIAKMYNTSGDTIAEANNIKTDAVTDRHVLLIPRKRRKALLSKII
ncbi:MAG: DUF3794 domain-containing protein [Eubacteriales bacterium]|nr:DUF3794 domain-containing protein [Eubacteriales bacterium]